MSFNVFLFPPNDSQPRFPLSTIIQQKAFLLLHQTNKYCWNQTPILKSKQKQKSSQNHHHLFHLNASSIPGRENKHGGRPNPRGIPTPWNTTASKTGQILFISIPWKRETTEPSATGNRSMDSDFPSRITLKNQTRFPPCTTPSPL